MVQQLIQGAAITLQISAASLAIGLSLGTLLGIFNCQKYKVPGIDLYVSILRGTPLFVQVLILYFGLGLNLTPLVAGILALGINSSAYVSEIVRCGIDSIPTGQWDASVVLGYSRTQALRGILLPQMIRNVLPALTNEMTSLIKETSILMVIGVSELTKVGRDIVARELDPMSIYLAVAAIYFLMTASLSFLAKNLEKRMQR